MVKITYKLRRFILFLLFAGAQLTAQNNPEIIYSPDQKLVYKKIDTVELKIHVFSPKSLKTSSKVPAIVFFFGGGWVGGTPLQFYEQAAYFASKGIVAACAEYRIESIHGTTPFESVRDAKSAIRWVRKHADELGVDPTQIVASGGSAGGHVAACTGVIQGYEEAGENLSISSVPTGMILFNPVIDTTRKGFGMDKVGKNRKKDLSPAHHVKEGIVPTIIFHGTEDQTVPFENVERFTRLMKKKKNSCILEPYKGEKHGFFNGSFFRKERARIDLYTNTLEKSENFLITQLGWQLKESSKQEKR